MTSRTFKYLIPALALFFLCAPQPLTAASVDRIVAVVNDEIITLRQLEGRVGNLMKAQKVPAAQKSEMEKKVLEAMIDQSLVAQAARKRGVMVSEANVDEAIRGIMKENNLNDAQFRASLAKGGTSYQDFREDIKAELIKNAILGNSVMSKVVVTDNEVTAFLRGEGPRFSSAALGGAGANANSPVRIIFLAGPKAKAMSDARSIKAEIEGGLDFAQAADKYSQGPGRGSGGNLDPEGNVTVSQLQPALQAAAAPLSPGQISEPVDLGDAVALLTVLPGGASSPAASSPKKSGKNEAGEFSPDERQAARRHLEQLKMQQRYLDWMSDLRRRAIIKITL